MLQPFENGGDPASGVVDLSWDSNEDHLLAAF